MVRRLVTLPSTLVTGFTEITTKNTGLPKEAAPTAVDNMLPGHRFLRTLSASPIPPGVTAHSIIPVKGEGPPARQDDGVVKYESAHIEGVASEKIVRSAHSTQSTPGPGAEDQPQDHEAEDAEGRERGDLAPDRELGRRLEPARPAH